MASSKANIQLFCTLAALGECGYDDDEILEMLAAVMISRNLSQRLDIPAMTFDLNPIDPDTCVQRFRMTGAEIRQMIRLLGVPEVIRTAQRVPVPAEEAFCVLLRRLSYPCRYKDIALEFGRARPVLCSIFNTVLLFMFARVEVKMQFDESTINRSMVECARAIHDKVGYIDKCIGFIDGRVRRICRPTKFQRVVYSGHKRVHCIKFQSITMANGLIVALHGSIEGRRHDSFILRDSKIHEHMVTNFPSYYLYGDSGYPLHE